MPKKRKIGKPPKGAKYVMFNRQTPDKKKEWTFYDKNFKRLGKRQWKNSRPSTTLTKVSPMTVYSKTKGTMGSKRRLG